MIINQIICDPSDSFRAAKPVIQSFRHFRFLQCFQQTTEITKILPTDIPQVSSNSTQSADILHITPKYREIVPPFHRQGMPNPFRAIRWPNIWASVETHLLRSKFLPINLAQGLNDGTWMTLSISFIIPDTVTAPEYLKSKTDICDALGLTDTRRPRGRPRTVKASFSMVAKARSRHRRTPAILDPVELARENEAVLHAQLSSLTLEQLKDIVAGYRKVPDLLRSARRGYRDGRRHRLLYSSTLHTFFVSLWL